ncbi:MAG: DUF962 domain-containing protein [Sphingobacteriaceae bacterium]|nr:MAG: DUF962 domain-containing protein [Sphingobacteriaceae bacterium]
MAKQATPSKANTSAPKQDREVDKLFAQYAAYHQHPINRLLQKIFVPLFCFGLLGLVWATPFPHLAFLGRYAGYINWASLLIGIAIYYYYKLSPVLSYFILFTVFGFSYGIISLEKWEAAGGPKLWQVSLLIFAAALVGISIGYVAEKKNPQLITRIKQLIIAPLYLWHLVVNKFIR